ncbi:MAG TPA: ATP-binding cassette domain-containing protein, partial [Chitinophagaceae bacterium]|nr:ATP-binding cassette domain-containing protein [Chitinophagaceae bacterium]
MHYVSAENLGISYGVEPLFTNISFHIEEGDRIALVAKNGTGKSTLLKLLAGREKADEGKLWIHKDVSVILFEQESDFAEEATILQNIFHLDHPVLNAIKVLKAATENGDVSQVNDAVSKMDTLNAWNFEAKIKQILSKLNIDQLHRPVKNLSGGQKKRIALAKTLIDIGFESQHVLLLMDEPTNHLDVAMVEWLEEYFEKENITLILVTHDRYFLDATCTEIWELEDGQLYFHKGDYQTYLQNKSIRIENTNASIDKAKNLYRKELEWMRKQPRARTTKSKSRQDNFYTIEKKAKTQIAEQQLQLDVKMNRLGGKIIELKKVYKNFGDKIILKGFDYTFKKGEKIGIIGKNGTGKSTFLNIIQG